VYAELTEDRRAAVAVIPHGATTDGKVPLVYEVEAESLAAARPLLHAVTPDAGVPVPRGTVRFTVDEVVDVHPIGTAWRAKVVARSFSADPIVVDLLFDSEGEACGSVGLSFDGGR
jgi:hypothetical protein